MQVSGPFYDVFVPDGAALPEAMARTTRLGIGAHPDDLEIIAAPGILACHERDEEWFTGVVVCDGAGSPRSGPYAGYSDADMVVCRREEQRRAANLGGYSALFQLGYRSADVREGSAGLSSSLSLLLERCTPRMVYLHNPADAHATHRAVLHASIQALRQLDPEALPEEILGVEVWRGLDWLPARLRQSLPIRDPEGLQAKLLRCHDSQVSGGKRYDEAILARQRANATLAQSHEVDIHDACALAMDLRPLLEDPSLTEEDFLRQCVEQFRADLLDG